MPLTEHPTPPSSAETPRRGRANALGMRLGDFESLLSERCGEPLYRARQVFAAVYSKRCTDFETCSDLPRRVRSVLASTLDLARPRVDAVQVSQDGTRKYRFVATSGEAFEAVYIPEVARARKTNTLCVSSQTGCAVGCTFCFTASLRRNRNLTPAEIVGQVLAVQDDVAPHGDGARVSNIVFMGMGEPLLNYNTVVRAIEILTDPHGIDFSTRRVTVSTAGIVPRIYDLGRDVRTQLAISLNATTDAVRDAIMPINRKWPLAELLAAMRAYPLAPRRRITVEYVLLGDVNDGVDDARRLVRLLAGIPVKVNLLPLNPHERTLHQPPREAQVVAFQEILRKAGVNAILRTPRGRDIAAACGQLGDP